MVIKVRSVDTFYVVGSGTIYVVDTKENIKEGDKIMLNGVEVEVKEIEGLPYSGTRKGIIVK